MNKSLFSVFVKKSRKPYQAFIIVNDVPFHLNVAPTPDGKLRILRGSKKGHKNHKPHPELLELLTPHLPQLTDEKLKTFQTTVILNPPAGWEQFAMTIQQMENSCVAAAIKSIESQGFRHSGTSLNKSGFWKGEIGAIQYIEYKRPELAAMGYELLHSKTPPAPQGPNESLVLKG